jgi:hypothetical protein
LNCFRQPLTLAGGFIGSQGEEQAFPLLFGMDRSLLLIRFPSAPEVQADPDHGRECRLHQLRTTLEAVPRHDTLPLVGSG